MSEPTFAQDYDINGDVPEQKALLSRLSSYTLVNTLYQGYSTIKEKSPYLKAGLETAESYTQPVLKKLDDTLHLDQRGVAILDKIETTATGITTKVSDYYNQGVDYYTNTKESAVETGKSLVANANRPVNQLLDITETLVNKLLPPELPVPPLDSDEDHEEKELEPLEIDFVEQIPDDEGDSRLTSNPLPRIKQMSTGVSKRLHNAAMSKLQNVNIRTQQQIDSMSYVVDLIQYAAEYIDLDGKTKVFKENATNVQHYFEEKRDEATHKLVIPAKEIIEQQTADIKEQGIKAVVTVVATIAHATEVVRRQVTNKVTSVAKLQVHLKEITARTKEAVLKLKGAELADYLEVVRETYRHALHSIIELTSTYTPTKLLESVPLLLQLTSSLSTWKHSLTARLALDQNGKGVKEPAQEKEFVSLKGNPDE